jgi:hypothetical protein
MHRVLQVAALLLLAGCAGTEHFGASVSQDLATEATSSAGLLLGSLGFGAPNYYTDLEFHFRRKSDSKSGSVRIPPARCAAGKTEIKGDGGRAVQVFAVPLPPGDYEFFTYLGYAPGGGDTNYGRPKIDFSIPFTIAAGHTTYVGEYIVESRPQMRSTGRLVPEARIVVADRLDRDLAVARDAGRPVGSAAPERAVPDMTQTCEFRRPGASAPRLSGCRQARTPRRKRTWLGAIAGERLRQAALAPGARHPLGKVGEDQHARPLVGVAPAIQDPGDRQRQRRRFQGHQGSARPERREPQLPGEAEHEQPEQAARRG